MLFAQFLDAQITTEEAPPIFDLYMPSLKGVSLNTSEQSLPSPDMKTIEMEDRANDGKRGGPLRFAYPVKVHYTLTNSGRWFDLKDGSKLWRLKVHFSFFLCSRNRDVHIPNKTPNREGCFSFRRQTEGFRLELLNSDLPLIRMAYCYSKYC